MGEHWGRVGEEVPICYVAHFLLVYIERRRNWVRGAKRRGSSAGRQIRRPTGTPTSSLRMHIVIAGECCFLPVGMGGVVRPVNRQPCRCADIFTVCLLPPDLPSLLPPPHHGVCYATNIERLPNVVARARYHGPSLL